MAVSKGGSSGNDNQSYSGQTASQSAGQTAGVTAGQTQTDQTQSQTGSQSGTTTGQQSGASTSGVVDNYGIGSFYQNNAPVGVGQTAANYFGNQLNRGSYTLGSLADKAAAGVPGYSSYAAPTPVTAQQGGTNNGSAYMGAYQTPLNNDYVNASLADYDQGAAQGYNALNAANADAFGNKRTGVAQGQFLADAARGRGTLSADTRLNAFNTAAGLGQTDASRQAATDSANADRKLSASQFNNTMTNQRQQFDVGAAYQGDQSRDSAASNLTASQGAGAAANNAYVAAGSPLLGQTSTNTGTTSGTSDQTSSLNSTLQSLANTFGVNLGATSDNSSGTSSGTKSGSQSSKGGGASLG